MLPTKLGYKQAKYLTSLRVTNVLGPQRGYWVDRGYSWHGGLRRAYPRRLANGAALRQG